MLQYANLPFIFLQHSETFDVSHVVLPLTIAELSTLKHVRFFGPPCRHGEQMKINNKKIFGSFKTYKLTIRNVAMQIVQGSGISVLSVAAGEKV